MLILEWDLIALVLSDLADVELPQVREALAARMIELEEDSAVLVESLPRDDSRASWVLWQPRL